MSVFLLLDEICDHDAAQEMCDSFASKRSKKFDEDISRVLTCGNIFKSFQKCHITQEMSNNSLL